MPEAAVIPFIETVPEASRSAVQTLVTNLGATTEELTAFKTFDEFATGYKPKAPASSQGGAFSWKTKLSPDLLNAPTMQKFEDTPEGLAKAVESHLSLEKLLGHEKVPIPKDEKDTEGWARFNKAMGIPDKPDGYGLPDVKLPDGVKGLAFDKAKFAEVLHANKLTPAQAKGIYKAYTDMVTTSYAQLTQKRTEELNTIVNQLRTEWGDAYDSNVDLGQTVINKFAVNQEEADYLTAILTQDPKAIRFLTKIGQQFAENKIGEFQYKSYSFSPLQAQAEIDKIMNDPNHPYINPKATKEEHDRAVQYVNNLYTVINKAKTG